MPQLIRFILTNIAIGTAIGWLVGLALVLSNAHGLGDLFIASDHRLAAIVLLAVSLGPTFGICYLGTALLLLSSDRD